MCSMTSNDSGETRTDLDRVKEAIDALPTNDRAALRPWLMATYDARGYPQPRYPDSRATSRTDAGHG